MEVLPLPEPDRNGYLLATAQRGIAIDPPLDTEAVTEFIPGWLRVVAVLETGIPTDRIAGGRLLAEAIRAPLYGPGTAIDGATPLRSSTRLPAFPELAVVPAPGHAPDDVAVLAAGNLFVGDLDRDGWCRDGTVAAQVASTRRALAGRFPEALIYGSTGQMTPEELIGKPLPAPAPRPLNQEAVELTNRGAADMFWADPRYGSDVREVDHGYITARAGSPWAPIILDLRNAGTDIDGARRIRPARLASEMTGLPSGKELVVLADERSIAEGAARFLARLGFNAVFVVAA